MKTGYEGYNSAEIGLLNRVAELARRFGLRPSEAEAALYYDPDPNFECGKYMLAFHGRPGPAGTDKGDRYDRMMTALGFEAEGGMDSEHIDAIEDVVERAISLAPRARSFG